jgi:hypothetical protein
MTATLVDERESTALDFGAGQDLEVQITTARRFPRSIKSFVDRALQMATLDEETSKACFYALPRDGKTIAGPSARLAEICAAAYQHLRVGAKVIREDEKWVYSVGAAWDVENNVAITFEVRRRITDRNQRRYNDDMIGVTGNAASSIALRNAVFKIIPSAFWRPIYEQCRKVAVGDAKSLAGRRAKMLEHFQKTMAVDPARIFAAIGVKGVEDITLEQLEILIGYATAIREGDSTVDEIFPPASAIPMPQRASEAAQNGTPNGAPKTGTNGTPAPTASAAPPPTPPSATAIPDGLDKVITAGKFPSQKTPGTFWWEAETARGLRVFTWDATHGATLEDAKKQDALIKLVAKPLKNGKQELIDVAIVFTPSGS